MFKQKLACSFCRRSATDVAKLVAGPRVYICDRCAVDVMRIMNESNNFASTGVARRTSLGAMAERLRAWWRSGRRGGSSRQSLVASRTAL